MKSILKSVAAAGLGLALSATTLVAGPLMDRINKGEPIRIGFANEVPWAYPGDNNKPLGFVNAYVLGVLHEMGYDNVKPVVTDWGGLIPGLNAGRFDMVTGGLYILNSRCQNVLFSEPMAKVGDAFIVPKGNPKNLNNYEQVAKAGATFVTGAGYNQVESAKKGGIKDSNVMTVPGPTEILAAVRAGRADAGGVTYFTAQNLAKQSGGTVQVSDVSQLPDWTQNWVGIGFRKNDGDFVKKFNAAQKKYLGSPAMMKAVEEYGYTKANLPGDKTSAEVCKMR
ncbi:ectoine/hydroxyectoine ABC transporter substrate-binding protein EhuB [Thioclava sp. BHET1]|uniref:ABC transporter substrate-binding protein n=1 Tax=Thioclava dalianensis TaxID=1185766 RepID=A0A074TLQ7_9RHOB|nr:ectoine/hydroxyectoine ABC transporter substrate-binding protein EhuB [Thioclava dalianensis]KEP71105.1 ABC transporter substrate-binding protein [Thioclava dalianensis]TMV93212.1 ectoine/hydroxyectoine ABC transporter substrate-binding protein EhuB [Thioclava sp. BHET1]SFN24740.1 polar amino acid transport system substrate-binding protein [Thioclava dalianensis]